MSPDENKNSEENSNTVSQDSCDVYVWGSNSSHQLAAGSQEKVLAPKLAPAFTNVQQVNRGGWKGVRWFGDGWHYGWGSKEGLVCCDVYVWGSNSSHQLAAGSQEKVLAPKLAPAFTNVQQVKRGVGEIGRGRDGLGLVGHWEWGGGLKRDWFALMFMYWDLIQVINSRSCLGRKFSVLNWLQPSLMCNRWASISIIYFILAYITMIYWSTCHRVKYRYFKITSICHSSKLFDQSLSKNLPKDHEIYQISVT